MSLSADAWARLRERLLDDLLRPASDLDHRANRLVNEVILWLEAEGA